MPPTKRAACDAAAAFFVLGGIAAIGVNAFYLHNLTAQGVWPAFLGLWFSLLTVVFGANIALRPRLAGAAPPAALFPWPCACFRIGLRATWPCVIYSFLSFVSLLVGIGYFVAFRPDGGVYGLVLAGVLAANAVEANTSATEQASVSEWHSPPGAAYKSLGLNTDQSIDGESEPDAPPPVSAPRRCCSAVSRLCVARAIVLGVLDRKSVV